MRFYRERKIPGPFLLRKGPGIFWWQTIGSDVVKNNPQKISAV
jgi:hypothetical protein